MNESLSSPALTLSIAAVERDTGLSKDTLRVWERRYGFPAPTRDAIGERAYPLPQVEKLRVLKRLLDVGHRPGRVVPLSLDELQTLSAQTLKAAGRHQEPVLNADELRAHVERIHAHDAASLRRALHRDLSRVGVASFINDVLGPLNAAVGEAWLGGKLQIFEEHLYSEAVQAVLRSAIASVPEPAPPGGLRVLLTTFPGEPHGLGLLMVEALLALEGCSCTPLGPETPLRDIVAAALALRVDVVGLSFTGCLNPNGVADGLQELRSQLPAEVQLWVGGSAPVLARRPVPGVRVFADLRNVAGAVATAQVPAPP